MPHRSVAPASVAIALAAAVLMRVSGAAAPAAAAPPLPLRYRFHVGMDAPVRMPYRWPRYGLDLEVGRDGTRYALDDANRRVLRYALDGRLINAWGWPGDGPGEFGDARTSIDVGPTGDVFVGDPSNGRVQRFTSWGAFVTDVCLVGRAADGTCAPDPSRRTSMAVLPDGRFAVGTSKSLNGRAGGDLTVYRPDGTLERTWTTAGIQTIESDSRGRIVAAEPWDSRVEVYDPNGTLLATLGRRGGEGEGTDPGTFDLCHEEGQPFGGPYDYDCNPWDVAIGPDDSIYVRMSGTRISRFLPDGRAVEALRTKLRSLAVAGDGSIVTAYDAALSAWSADGTPGPTWSADPPLLSPPPDGPSGAFFDPVAVAPVGDGAVMSDTGAGALQWLGPRGELGRRLPTQPCNGGAPLEAASALAPAPDGGLLAAFGTDGCVQLLSADGVPGRTWGGRGAAPHAFVRLTGVAAGAGPDGADRLWVADAGAGRVVRFGWDGAFEVEWTAGPDGVPLGAVAQPAVAPDGSVWVADPDHDRVAHFTADGVPLGAVGAAAVAADGLLKPTGVAVTADGTVIVADTGHARLMAYRPDGTLLASWDGGDVPGARLREPVGLGLARDGTLWVADREANRVVAFAAALPTAWHVRYYRDDGLLDGPVFIQSAARLDLDWGAAPPAAGLPASGFTLRAERPAGLPDGDRLLTLTLRGGAALSAPAGRAPIVVAGDPAVKASAGRLRADDWLRIDYAARAAHPMLRLDEGALRQLFFPTALRGDR